MLATQLHPGDMILNNRGNGGGSAVIRLNSSDVSTLRLDRSVEKVTIRAYGWTFAKFMPVGLFQPSFQALIVIRKNSYDLVNCQCCNQFATSLALAIFPQISSQLNLVFSPIPSHQIIYAQELS